jgi:hypothetical protein
MAGDPDISGCRSKRHNLGHRRWHSRDHSTSIMSPHPEPGPAAPHPMAGNPCIPCPGGRRDNLDARGGHRTLHDSNLSRRGTGAKASKKPSRGQRQCLGAGSQPEPEHVAHPSFLRQGRIRLPAAGIRAMHPWQCGGTARARIRRRVAVPELARVTGKACFIRTKRRLSAAQALGCFTSSSSRPISRAPRS